MTHPLWASTALPLAMLGSPARQAAIARAHAQVDAANGGAGAYAEPDPLAAAVARRPVGA